MHFFFHILFRIPSSPLLFLPFSIFFFSFIQRSLIRQSCSKALKNILKIFLPTIIWQIYVAFSLFWLVKKLFCKEKKKTSANKINEMKSLVPKWLMYFECMVIFGWKTYKRKVEKKKGARNMQIKNLCKYYTCNFC